MGMSEESDALIVAVSEETGSITVFENENMTKAADYDSLVKILSGGFLQMKDRTNAVSSYQ